MARLIATSNLLVAALSDGAARFTSRRGYAAAAAAMGRASTSAAEKNVMMMKGAKEGGETVWTSSWVPDPVTGYYRPANHRVEVMDPAELREILLPRKSS